MPTWVLRAKNPEGEFLRLCGCQWVTSSGYMDCVSAGGKHLGHFPSAKVLDKFRKLPEEQRKPGGGVIADLKPGESVLPEPPKNGVVLKVHTRAMARDQKGALRTVKVEDYPLWKGNAKSFTETNHYFGPNTDYMWITESEWRSLFPEKLAKGQKREVGRAIVDRLAIFHLMPRRLTSEGASWSKSQLKKAHLTSIVEEITTSKVRLRLVGFAHLGSTYNESQATTPNGPLAFGYEAPLHGRVEFDRKKDAITRFDLFALGDVWGRWGDANNKSQTVERPGRNPIPIAFELATGASPTERIPPGGNGSYVQKTGYFGK
ncbi:MAG: hypothetical protein HYX68_05285 [Planctomycetes bacterium]|nr:hypothetical protein [Planctomycetota bacterium]